jgi:hypothetical protein
MTHAGIDPPFEFYASGLLGHFFLRKALFSVQAGVRATDGLRKLHRMSNDYHRIEAITTQELHVAGIMESGKELRLINDSNWRAFSITFHHVFID